MRKSIIINTVSKERKFIEVDDIHSFEPLVLENRKTGTTIKLVSGEKIFAEETYEFVSKLYTDYQKK